MGFAGRLSVWLAAVTLLAVTGVAEAKKKKRRPPPDATAAGEGGEDSQIADNPVSLFGTSLRLGTVLDQLARNHGFQVIYGKDINMRREVDIPSLTNVPLRSALKVILTPIGYSFAFEGTNLVVFSRYTRIFRVNVPMLKQTWDTSFSNEASEAGSGGQQGGEASAGESLGAKIALTNEASSKGFWEEMEANLKTLVTGEGAFSVNQVAGLVTVTDTPEALDAVERYVDMINEEMARQIVVEVRVAEVTLDDTTSAGIDWNAVSQSLGGIVGTASTVGTVPFVGADGLVSFSFKGINGSAVLRALEQQGEVSLVLQPNLLVGNNLPSMMQVGHVLGYVASVTVSQSEDGISTSVIPGVLSEGLTMSLLPRLNPDGSIKLAISVVLQELIEVTTRAFIGGSQVDLPALNRRTYAGVVSAKHGETIVVGGLIDKREKDESAGVPLLSKIPLVGIFFGSQVSEDYSSELVILLTPRPSETAKPSPQKMEKFIDPNED